MTKTLPGSVGPAHQVFRRPGGTPRVRSRRPGRNARVSTGQLLEKIRVPRIGPGGPRKKPDSLAADNAYSNGPCRA